MSAKGIVEIAYLGVGETKRIAFEGESIGFMDAVDQAGFNLDEVVLIEVDADKVAENDLEDLQLRSEQVVYLTPEVVGGR